MVSTSSSQLQMARAPRAALFAGGLAQAMASAMAARDSRNLGTCTPQRRMAPGWFTERSGFVVPLEKRFDAQILGDALAADASIEFLMPVIDAPLLIVERDAAKSWRHQRFLNLRAELQILVEDAVEVGDARLPQLGRWSAAPVGGEPMAFDPHARIRCRPEQKEGDSGGVHRRDEIRIEVEGGIVMRGNDRRRFDAPHATRAGVLPVGTAVRGHHDGVPMAVQRNGGAAMVEKPVHRTLVNRLQMIDLEEGIQQHFDVALDVEAFLRDQPPSLRLKLFPVLVKRFHMPQKRFSLGTFIDKHPVVELFAAHADQRARRHVERGEVALVAQVHQLAFERIGPAVIAADQAVDLTAGSLHQRSAAMPAGVVESADDIVLAAHDEYGCAGLLPEQEAAGLRQLVDMAGIEPAPMPQMLRLEFEKFGVRVAAGRMVPLGRGCALRLVLHTVEEALNGCRVHDLKNIPATRKETVLTVFYQTVSNRL